MKTLVRITHDEPTDEWKAQQYQIDDQGNETPARSPVDFSTYERTEKYGNQLYNGTLEVEEADGSVMMYGDGCHIVQHEAGPIRSMSKQEYVTFSGRPGSENED